MSSLPAEVDFFADRSATEERMNRAMAFLVAWLRRVESVQPEFLAVTAELKTVGLQRLDAVLSPIFVDAQGISAQLAAIRTAWLTGQPLTQLIADLTAQVTGRLATVDGKLSDVDARLAANLAAMTAQLAANATSVGNQLTTQNASVDGKLAELSPAAKWAVAMADEARAATAQRLISAAILWSMLEPVPLTDAALIAVDLSKGVHFTLPIGGNRTLAAPTNGKPGQEGFIRVVQDGLGARTLSFAAAWRFPDLATAPSLNAAAGAVTLLRYHVSAAGEFFITGGKPASGGGLGGGYASGRYYTGPYTTGLGYSNEYDISTGQHFATPITVTAPISLAALAFRTNKNTSARMSLYSSLNGKPNLLLYSSDLTASVINANTDCLIAGSPIVPPGTYWVAWAYVTYAPVVVRNSSDFLHAAVNGFSGSIDGAPNQHGVIANAAYNPNAGPAPAAFGASTFLSGQMPLLALKAG